MHTLVPWYSIPVAPFMLDLAQGYPPGGYGEGMHLLEAHCVTSCFMVIEEGICQYEMGGRNLNTVGFIGPGSSFGAISCVSPYASHCCVSSLTAVRARAVPGDVLIAHLEENAADACEFLRYVVDKNNQVWKAVALLMSLSARERFLYFVNSCIYPQTREKDQEYYRLTPDLSQTRIADMLAINRITLARLIRPLRESGLVRTSGSSLYIRRDCLDALSDLRGNLLPIVAF